MSTMRGQLWKKDNTAETQLLDTILAEAAKFGVTATIEQRDIQIGDRRFDAYVHT